MKKFQSYSEFWIFYLQEHSKSQTKWIHAAGTLIGLGLVGYGIFQARWGSILLGFTLAYGLAWASHFLVEKNRPATFRHPLWSFFSDFRMVFHLFRGRY